MKLNEAVEAYLAGKQPAVPAELRREFDIAVRGHEALHFALGETIIAPDTASDERRPLELPDDYEIVRELGRGGMGVVYLARQRSLGRDIAVKVLRPGEATYSPLVRRFMEEARHLARLRHPHIVSIHEIGEAASEPYFTMDFVDGESLADVLAGKHLSPSQALAILKQAASGIQHAHAHGIIHRDLKPGNILLDSTGHAYVTDFGLARDMSQNAKLTRSGEIMGTPVYMAPEQARGATELIGEGTDIHGLGAILYEMLTGRPPYGCDSPATVLVRLLNEDPVPPRRLDRRIPRDLENICLKTLAKSPDKRYASVQALQEDIRRFESGEPVLAKRPGLLVRGWQQLRRHAKSLTAIAAAVLLTVLLAAFVGPRLFDKTMDELIAWGDEAHGAGQHDQAVEVYRRALEKAAPQEQAPILERIVRCCREMDDPRQAVSTALEVLEFDPKASFGKYDYLVAQAVYARTMEQYPDLSARIATRSQEALKHLEQAAERHQLVLDGSTTTPQQREQSLAALQRIHAFLARSAETGPQPVDSARRAAASRLPEGPLEQLLATADDPAGSRWQRGLAAYAAGRKLEAAHDRLAASERVQQAFELMRTVFPYYSGISTTTMRSRARGVEHVESAECELIRDVFADCHRLDPDFPDSLDSGIRFRIRGVEIPDDVVVKLDVLLYEATLDQPAKSDISLPRTVPVEDQVAALGVASGRYRMRVREGGVSVPGDVDSTIGRLLELDLSDLPQQLELAGETVEFDIPGRLCNEILMLEPVPASAVDLRTADFRWTQIPGAAYYLVTLVQRESRVGEGLVYTGGAQIRVDSNSMCVGTLPPVDRKKAAWLRTGVTVTWQVAAFDAENRRIGASTQSDRYFLVGRGLDE